MSTILELLPADEKALAEKQLITLDPAAYVAAVFKPFQTRLDALKVEAPKITYDIATTEGLETAKQWRAKCKAVRIEADKEREFRKAPVLKIGKELEARYKEIEAAVEPLEDRFDKDIKALEAKKEAERQAKIAAELHRTTSHQRSIDSIRSWPNEAVGKPSANVLVIIETCRVVDSERDWEEFKQQAEDARAAAISALEKIHAERVAFEAEQERIRQEREELAQLRRQQAAQEAEVQRVRKVEAEARRVQQDAEDAEKRRLQKIEDDRLAGERQRLADQQAEIDRQRRELEQQQTQAAEQERQRVETAEAQQRRAEKPRVRLGSAPFRPTDDAIIHVLCTTYSRDRETVTGWIREMQQSMAKAA